jgi:hypothetical protein
LKQQEKKIEKAKSEPEKPERVRTPDCVFRYANNITIVNTQFDLQFLFGQLVFETNSKLVINEHAVIAMSPAHAKSVHELLGRRLRDWENSFGKIELKRKGEPKKGEVE